MFRQKNNKIFKKTSGSRIFPCFFFATILLLSFYLFAVNIYSCSESTAPDNNNGPDTTSHNFTWIVDTLGDRGSYLHDVDIIDNNKIWAAGEIYKEEITPYNTAYWNGRKWELKRLFSDKVISPVQGLWAISDEDIWLAAGSIYHWDGIKANRSYLRDISTMDIVKQLFYFNENNIYAVGTNGLALYYGGNQWHRLESGTETIITDIWGTVDSKEAKQTVLCTVSDRWHVGEKRLLSVNTNNIKDTLNWNYEDRLLMSVWFDHDSPVYVGGTGLVMRKDSLWQEIPEVPDYRILRVRGSSRNNVFVVGVYGLLMHYNGATWRRYPELEMENGELRALAVKDDIVVAAGITDNRGVIIRGIKN